MQLSSRKEAVIVEKVLPQIQMEKLRLLQLGTSTGECAYTCRSYGFDRRDNNQNIQEK
jgi:hypothetical protein